MTKLNIDLTTLSQELADAFRERFNFLLSRGVTGIRWRDNRTRLELDYGINDLTSFKDFGWPSPQELFRRAVAETVNPDAGNPGGSEFKNPRHAFEAFGTDAYKDATRDLRGEAEQRCRDFDYADEPPDAGDAFDGPGEEAIEAVLEDHDGLVIGGSHDDNTHRAPVLEALRSGAISRDAGTGLLFIEEMSAFAQDMVDDYLQGDPDAEMAPALKTYLNTLKDTQGKFDFPGMLELAKQHNVRVVGIDTAEAKILDTLPGALHHVQRCAKMNDEARRIMQDAMDAAPNQKFVALVGSAHIDTHAGGVPGIAQMFNVPGATATASGRLVATTEDEANRDAPSAAETAFIDAYINALDAKLGGEVDAHLHWSEQYDAARAKVREITNAGIHFDENDVGGLIAGNEVDDDLNRLRDLGRARTDAKEELSGLIEAGDPDAFRDRLAELLAADADLLRFDGIESTVPSIAVQAVKGRSSDLIPAIAAAGAPIADSRQSQALFGAAVEVFRAEDAIDGVDAGAGLTATLGLLIAANADVNGENKRGTTPLQKLAEEGHAAQMGQLIAAGADAGARTEEGASLMSVALASGHPGVAQAMIASGVGLNERDENGTNLQKALKAGRVDIARALIAAGAALDGNGEAELRLALDSGDVTLFTELANRDPNPADPNAPGPDGKSGLRAALERDVARRADEALNGAKRIMDASRSALDAKQVELAAKEREIATEEDRAAELYEKAKAHGPDHSDVMNSLTRLVTNDLPALQADKTRIEGERDAAAAQFANDEADWRDNHLFRAEIEASEGRLAMRRNELGAMNNGDPNTAEWQRMIADEEAHIRRLQARQTVPPAVVAAIADEIEADAGDDGFDGLADIAAHLDAEAALERIFADHQGAHLQDVRIGTELQQAMDAGNLHRAQQLLDENDGLLDELVPGDEFERTMLHYVAAKQNADMVRELVERGADVTARDKFGGTPMHSLFAKRQDDPDLKDVQRDLMRLMIEADDTFDVDTQDSLGRTPLHLACADGNASAITYLLSDDVGAREDIADARGWTPQDVVVATTKPLAEDAYAKAAANNTLDQPLVRDGEGPFDTVQILMRATKCESGEDEARVEEMYKRLYADPALRPILELAALDAVNPHSPATNDDPPTGLRIVVAQDKQVGVLYNKTSGIDAETGAPVSHYKAPVGAYEEMSHVVMLGAGAPEGRDIAGTLVHELTHAAARILYGEDDVPCAVPPGGFFDENGKMRPEAARDNAYVAAIMQDAKSATLCAASNDPDDKNIYETLFNRFNGEYKDKGDHALLQEYLVAVPQLIAQYGLDKVSKVAPGLTGYFTGSFTDAVSAKIESDDYAQSRGKVDRGQAAVDGIVADAGVLRPRETQETIYKRDPGAQVGDIKRMVEDFYRAEKGRVVPPAPTFGAPDNTSIPYSPDHFQMPPGKAQQRYESRMADVELALQAAHDAHIGSMPPDVPREAIALMARNIASTAIEKSGSSLRKAVDVHFGDYVRDSKRFSLEDKVRTGATLTNEDIAEMTLIRAEDEAFVAANPNAAPPPRPHYDAEVHAQLVSAFAAEIARIFPEDDPTARRKRGALMYDPADFQATVDAQKDALLENRKTMRGKRGGDVMIKTDRAKQAWFAKLQELSAAI